MCMEHNRHFIHRLTTCKRRHTNYVSTAGVYTEFCRHYQSPHFQKSAGTFVVLNISDWLTTRSVLFQPPFFRDLQPQMLLFCSLCFNMELQTRNGPMTKHNKDEKQLYRTSVEWCAASSLVFTSRWKWRRVKWVPGTLVGNAAIS